MKKILFFALFAALLPVLSQAQSASERRAARQKTAANMKDFDSEDPLFAKAEIPEKWKNRSAVVIAERVELNYMANRVNEFSGKVRRQTLLLDQAAVEEFGSITYQEDAQNRTGIQIIKADGRKIIVDMTAAAPFKEELNDRRTRSWNTYVRGGKEKRKVALAGLEVGDIVDIVTELKDELIQPFMPSCTDVINFEFTEEYPVMRRSIQFNVSKTTSVSAVSLNGAPKLRLTGDSKDNIQTYLVSGEMFEDDTLQNRFTYGQRTGPILKVMLCFAKGSRSKWDNFTGTPGEIKSYVDEDEFQEMIANAFKFRTNGQTGSHLGATYIRYTYWAVGKSYKDAYQLWLGRHFRGEKDAFKVADALYYKIRYDFTYGEFSANARYLNDELFAVIFVNALRKFNREWDVQLAVAPGRHITDRKSLLTRNELYWFTSINYKGTRRLYFPIDDHSKPTDEYYRLAGNEAYIVFVDRKDVKERSGEKFRIPEITPGSSGVSYEAKITINENNEMVFDAQTTLKGSSRLNSGDQFLSNIDFGKEDQQMVAKLAKEKLEKSATSARKEKKEEVGKNFDQEENEKNKLERLKARVERAYKVVSYDGYKVVQPGRYPNQEELIVTEKYTITDMVSKAGRNLIVSVGMLPGEYSRIDTSVNRVNPISIDYPVSNRMVYELQIPDGYQAEGIEALNSEVSNGAGTFKSRASLEGNALKVAVERTYHKTTMPVSEWGDFTRFMNAASDFNQKKLILRKI